MAAFDPILSKHTLRQVSGWCGVHGLMYTDGDITWTPAPIALTPTPYPASAYNFAKSIQSIWNSLIDRISRDRDFLRQELSAVGAADAFTERVLELFETLPEETVRNSLQLAILRSDYMLDYAEDGSVRPLQVEINTISSSFGSLSYKINRFHRDVLGRSEGEADVQRVLDTVHGSAVTSAEIQQRHEENFSLPRIAAALAAAHKAYVAAHPGAETADVRVLIIEQPRERNQGDQRALEQELWQTHGIRVEFATLTELATLRVIDESGDRLLLRRPSSSAPREVSVAYYRAGYTPADYPSETEWLVRAEIERSRAVKCPSAGCHLAGTKAVQAALCKPQVLERFLSPAESAQLRQCFAQQFSLGDATVREAAQEAVRRACEDGAKWVLKPQREGGGNNFYGSELSSFLKTHAGGDELSGYVLMQRIFPRVQQTAFVRQGACVLGPSISELGIFSAILSRREGNETDAEVLLDDYCGYLLRAKVEGVDEGGIATGFAVAGSIYLV